MGLCYFLVTAQESNQRKRLKGRYEQMRPLKKPPPPRRKCSAVLLYIPGDARREGYIGEGVFGARERDTQRLPYAGFFSYFSCRDKKSTL